MAKPIKITILGDASHLDRAVGKAQSTLGGLARGAAKYGALFGAALAGGTVVAGKALFDLGANIEAIDSKATTVFGNQVGVVERWAKANAATMGLTARQVKGLATDFADLLIPMGFTREQAAALSTQTVGLSGALAEWSRGKRTAAEVSTILSKAMLGERDGLKELGISITEADVQARLAAKGQDKLTGAALEQAKALATSELIFAKSTDAQAAYARGGNRLTRTVTRTKAVFGELAEKVAVGVLPVLLAVGEFVTDRVVPAVERAGPVVGRVFRLIGAAVAALRDGDLHGFAEVVDGLFGNTGRLIGPVRAFATGVAVVLRGAGRVVETVLGLFRSKGGEASGSAGRLAGVVRQLAATVGSVFAFIGAVVVRTVTVIRALWDQFGAALLARLQGTLDGLLQALEGALQILGGVFDLLRAILTGKWGEAWDAIKQIAAGVLDVIVGLLRAAGHALLGVLTAILGTLQVAWSAGWAKVRQLAAAAFGALKAQAGDAVSEIVGLVTGLPGRLLALAGRLGDAARDLGGQIIGGLAAGIAKVGGLVTDLGRAVHDAVVGVINGLIGRLNDAIPDSLGAGPLRIDLPDDPIPMIRAMGGPAAGAVRVGERGPETVLLPKGSRVIPHHAAAAGAPSITVNVRTGASPYEIADALAWAWKTSGR